ncbi:hypothetical protein CSE45_0820 [Citreicella sp. SE45]|nr:hypothetical protein CSE45_0820 [Citreicella sp. SE45]
MISIRSQTFTTQCFETTTLLMTERPPLKGRRMSLWDMVRMLTRAETLERRPRLL